MQLITQKNIKLQNMMKVFQEIYRQGSISRQTLASKTGTVSYTHLTLPTN